MRKEYKENEKKAHGYNGLLKRIQISHEKGGIIPWVILAVFLCIETGPIIFKLMLTKGPYDYMVENNNHKRNVENGIFKEDYIYEGVNGVIHMEKYKHLEVESARFEKEKKIEEQNKITELLVKKWGEKKYKEADENPDKFIKQGDDSINNKL